MFSQEEEEEANEIDTRTAIIFDIIYAVKAIKKY